VKNDQEMYDVVNERTELGQFKNRFTERELRQIVKQHEDTWRPFFEEEFEGNRFPRHPWKVLKEAREIYAEQQNGGDWPSLEKRYALRVVKERYAERWREYKEDFRPDEPKG